MARIQKSKQPRSAEPSSFKLWLEEAWHGWMKSLGSIVVLLVAYLIYNRSLVPESAAGVVVVAAIILGTVGSAIVPVFGAIESRAQRLLFAAFAAVWAISSGYSSVHRVLPTKAIGEPLHVAFCSRYKDPVEKKDCADPVLAATAILPEGGGPYELEVSGNLKGQGEAEASYRLTVTGANGANEELEGTLKRTYFHQRTSRRGAGGTAVRQEHTENSHRLKTRGASLKVSAEGIDDQLENGLTLAFHPAGPDPMIFLGLTALCLLIALGLDIWLADGKKKTYLAAAAGITLVFAWNFPTEATPNSLVRPAVGALILALITGGFAGWLLAVIGKSFRTRPKKNAAR